MCFEKKEGRRAVSGKGTRARTLPMQDTQSQTDAVSTIAAQATARGSGAIAVIRISGPRSLELMRSLFVPHKASSRDFEPWKLRHGRLHDGARQLDDVLCVWMPGPNSYTGEDCCEIHCHGGQAVVTGVLDALFAHGAVPARRGEFSRRAYLNGRMDLSQAEAVAELIAAPCPEAAEQSLRRLDGELSRRVAQLRSSLETVRVHMSLAVDFPEDEVEILDRASFLELVQQTRADLDGLLRGVARARVTREGARVVLAGSVNAGKSSLMNAILGKNRALVTDVPGTTRDFIEEACFLDEVPVRLVDTAGLRESADTVESMGMARSREQIVRASCLLLVVDGALAQKNSNDNCPDPVVAQLLAEGGETPCIIVWNKSDLAPAPECPPSWCRLADGSVPPFAAVCALDGTGVDTLCAKTSKAILGALPPDDGSVAPNDRQASALCRAAEELEGLARDIEHGQLYDLLAVRLDMACACLDECVGMGTASDVLNRVFDAFCIGK